MTKENVIEWGRVLDDRPEQTVEDRLLAAIDHITLDAGISVLEYQARQAARFDVAEDELLEIAIHERRNVVLTEYLFYHTDHNDRSVEMGIDRIAWDIHAVERLHLNVWRKEVLEVLNKHLKAIRAAA
ncbi:hypothetical protein [Shimia thalassica]|uniref:hypothetical protein n=1 Tax=Shimia thalassica TaxID=1715693 RepID=UPI0026E34687|nr:hypothetical protein [Shimia thalassica]MDO6479132.1 hypothetical protein [Shimia thalassica]